MWVVFGKVGTGLYTACWTLLKTLVFFSLLFYLFCGAENQTLGLIHSRQVLYLNYTPAQTWVFILSVLRDHKRASIRKDAEFDLGFQIRLKH
jgi:hypothetical protein